MLSLFFLDWLRRALVLAVLLLAGVSDYRTREVSDAYWVAGASVLAPLLLYLHLSGYYDRFLYAVSALAALAISLVAWRAKLVAEADVLALGFIGVFEPPTCCHPLTIFPLAATVIFSGAAALAASVYNAYWNIRRGAAAELRGLSLGERLAALLTMRLVTREDYERRSYMLLPSVDQSGKPRVALTVDDHVSPPAGLERFWASVLLPYVFLLALGFAAYSLLLLLLC